MSRVFLLQPLHLLNEDDEDVKTLGIYASREEALKAVERFRRLSGFKDVPQMADVDQPGSDEGFYISEYELNADDWSEGYVTV